MPSAALSYIFGAILLIYFSGGILSLVLSKNQRLSNSISNIFSLTAALSGIILSLAKILFYSRQPLVLNFNSGIRFMSINFYIDNLSAFFVLLISTLAFAVSLYSFSYMKHYFNKYNTGLFGFLYNFFVASMLSVITSGHAFFFLLVWEMMSLVSYFLVVFENEKQDSQKAGIIYIIMTHIGTAFIIAAFTMLYKYTGTAEFYQMDLAKAPVMAKNIIFIFLFIGFGTKAGIIPMHIWLPHAHPEAPSNISALMSGVMIKTAIYGIIRFVFCILSPEVQWWGTVLLIAGAVSAILGIAYALMENNIKRLLAYSSIENVGIILIGLGVSTIAQSEGNSLLAAFALTAAVLHIFNHSLFKGLLFLGAGAIHYSTGTKNLEKLGGLIKKMPHTSLFFLIGALSISAIPPFNGFVSEWVTYQSLFLNITSDNALLSIVNILIVALLAMAGALAAYCFVKVYGMAFLALPRSGAAEEAREVPGTMRAGMGLLTLLCIVAGILPLYFIQLVDFINLEVIGITINENVTAFSSFVAYPVSLKNASVSPFGVVLLAMLLTPLVFYILSFANRKRKTRNYGTWDCGYSKLDSRMEYTATGFSKPMRIVFRGIYRPQRELKVEEGVPPYFIKSAKYIVSTQSVFEKYLYDPVIKNVMKFARRTRLSIQTGSIHTYLIYMFIVIISMFVYYAVNK